MEYKHVFFAMLFLLAILGGIILSNTDKLNGYNDKAVLKVPDADSDEDFAKLQDALSQNPAIKLVEIGRKEQQLIIVHDPQLITQFDILRSVEKAGFQARIEGWPLSRQQKIPQGGCCAF